MFLPRDEAKYERLNTSFTDFGGLVADLKAQRHTGYVEVTTPANQGLGYIFFCAANATQFPFLDPFAAEFDYREGRISFRRPADHTFNNAIGFCMRETVRGLASELKQKNLVLLIRTTLAAPIARYVETIDELDLRATLPELLS